MDDEPLALVMLSRFPWKPQSFEVFLVCRREAKVPMDCATDQSFGRVFGHGRKALHTMRAKIDHFVGSDQDRLVVSACAGRV